MRRRISAGQVSLFGAPEAEVSGGSGEPVNAAQSGAETQALLDAAGGLPPEKRRCPHDGGTCHTTGGCAEGECYREEGGMSLTTPWPGYPRPGHDFEACPEAIPDHFNVELAAKARDIGIARVEAATDEWQEEALAVIRSVAQAKPTLTTDDVWRELGRDTELEGRAMGAAMRMAAKLGYVRRTDTTRKSERVACHRRDLRVWESLLCR